MSFKLWLNENSDIDFASFMKTGEVTVYIDGKRYVYVTDAMHHPKWQKMLRYGPGRVLNDIKRMVDAGVATQIVPPPAPKVIKPEAKPQMTQQRLF
jgi:hypothetical protein